LCSGSNTDYKYSEPLNPCYVMLICYNINRPTIQVGLIHNNYIIYNQINIKYE